MPAEIIHPQEARMTFGTVNVMVDTLIANVNIEDLRAITRNLLVTGPPGLVASFTAAARSRLCQTNAKRVETASVFFATGIDGVHATPTLELGNVLTRARSLYGAGMGFTGLGILSSVVKATVGLRWEQEGPMTDILAVIDTDVTQAIQSCKEELGGGRVNDIAAAREMTSRLRTYVEESCKDVEVWGGEFPFERAADSIRYWRF